MVHPRIYQPVVFRVENINRLAYGVTISSKDSVLATTGAPDSTLKKNAAKPPLDTLPKKVVDTGATVTGKNINSAASTQTKKNVAKQVTDYSKSQAKLQTAYLQLTEQVKSKQARLGVLTGQKDTAKAAGHTDTSSATKIRKVTDSISLLTKKRDSLKQKLSVAAPLPGLAAFNKQLLVVKSAYLTLEHDYQDLWDIYAIKDKLAFIAADPLLTETKFQQMYAKSLNNYRGDKLYNDGYLIKQYYLDLSNFNSSYSDLKNNSDISSLDSNAIKKLMAPADDLNKLVTGINAKLKKRNPGNDLKIAQNYVNWLFNPEAYRVSSTPIQPAQDIVLFDIRIKAKDSATVLGDSRRFSYREYVRGGVRYDVSTGIVFSFGVGDHTYSKQAIYSKGVATDSSLIVSNKRNNLYTPSIAAMLHASIRTWKTANLAATLGASINTSTLDINSIFPGLSLMVGKGTQFVFTAGPAFQKVNFLQEQYHEKQSYLTSSLPDVIPTSETFRIGFFFGISINLTKAQKAGFKLVSN